MTTLSLLLREVHTLDKLYCTDVALMSVLLNDLHVVGVCFLAVFHIFSCLKRITVVSPYFMVQVTPLLIG